MHVCIHLRMYSCIYKKKYYKSIDRSKNSLLFKYNSNFLSQQTLAALNLVIK